MLSYSEAGKHFEGMSHQYPVGGYDPFDLETLNSRLLRGIGKRLFVLAPACLYRLGVVCEHVWPESIALLGQACLVSEDTDGVNFYTRLLLRSRLPNGGWGLPVPWHSGPYLFPVGTLMSTTTVECGTFFLEKYLLSGERESKSLALEAAEALVACLRWNRVGHGWTVSYTPLDTYCVNNAMLLTASYLSRCSAIFGRASFADLALGVGVSFADRFSDEGAIPYFCSGGRVDGYHQAFCIRSLHWMAESLDANFLRALRDRAYLYMRENLIDESGCCRLEPDPAPVSVLDLQATLEAIRAALIIGDMNAIADAESVIRAFRIRGRLRQRIYRIRSCTIGHSGDAHFRQGIARFHLVKEMLHARQ